MTIQKSIKNPLPQAIRYRLHKHRQLLGDVIGNGLWRLSSLLYPLLLVIVVSRGLTPEVFGQFMVLLGLVVWLNWFIGYGFEFTATRRTLLKEGATPIHEELQGVWSAQVVLSCLALLGTGLALYSVPVIGDNPLAAFLVWGFAVLQALTPRWFFRMQHKLPQLAFWEWLPKLVSLPVCYAAITQGYGIAALFAIMCVFGFVLLCLRQSRCANTWCVYGFVFAMGAVILRATLTYFAEFLPHRFTRQPMWCF